MMLLANLFLADDRPTWPHQYQVHGAWILPEYPGPLRTPADIYVDVVDPQNVRKAMLLRGGLEKRLQIKGFNYRLQKLHDVEEMKLLVDCVNDSTADIPEVLPDLTNWTDIGVTVVLGRQVRQYSNAASNRIFYYSEDIRQPIRLEMGGSPRVYFDFVSWGPSIDEAVFVEPATCQQPVHYPAGTCSAGTQNPPSDIPSSFSWRGLPFLRPAGAEFNCEAGYGWAVAQSISVQLGIAGAEGPASAQQIIDCTYGEANHGCRGGSVVASMAALVRRGIPIADGRGYHFIDCPGHCPTRYVNTSYRVGACQTPANSQNLKFLIYQYGPVAGSFSVNWSTTIGQCNSEEGHGYLITGWTPDGWEVMNSLGPTWGPNGDGFGVISLNCGLGDTALPFLFQGSQPAQPKKGRFRDL